MSDMLLELSNSPNQTFKLTVDVDGNNITLDVFLRFNEMAGYWLMDLSKDGTALVASLPLVPGNNPAANLLHQYQHLEIGSMFLLKVGATEEEWPGETTLATNWAIIWGDTR